METKRCQNCKSDFVIEPDDFAFYEKIKVPPPTFCPACRLQRRLLHRNERTLYKRSCDLCKKSMIARYAPESPYTVYCPTCWYSDKWDRVAYGREYDFSRPFFEQFGELLLRVPRISVISVNAVNSDYVSQCRDVKNCYMATSIVSSENINYSYRVDKSRDCFDVAFVEGSEGCVELTYGVKSSGVSHSVLVEDSFDSQLLYDCRNCKNSILCINKRNASYQIGEAVYSKEEFTREREKLNLGSYKNLKEAKARLLRDSLRYPRKFAYLEQCVNVIGDHIYNSKNCYSCFDSYGIENCKYMLVGIAGAKDCQDISFGGLKSELCYEGTSIIGSHIFFSIFTQPAQYVWYSDSCDASFLFGCSGIHGGQYYILNKPYSKEEFMKLKDRIVEQMNAVPYTDKRGNTYRYGEYFPPELSAFAYNESHAQDYFPLSKEEVLGQGMKWREREVRSYEVSLTSEDIPDHIRDADDSITEKIISCDHKEKGCVHQCASAFRILPLELQFYRTKGLPLPRLCSNCRHYERLIVRNPLQLWHRTCTCAGEVSSNGIYQNTASHTHGSTACLSEFETSYSPDRPEIVYCAQCYQAEVN